MTAPDAGGPMDPAQRRLAERRLLQVLQRLHRREPLRADHRVDTLIEAVRSQPVAPGRGHRGAQRLILGDAALLVVVEALVAEGRVLRSGHRVRLPDHVPGIEPEMRQRVDRLLDGLRQAGAAPPRVEGVAARFGIPPGVLDELRRAGELVAVAPGIDYPRDTWEALRERIDRLAATGPLTIPRVRDGLRTSRRHAEALLAQRRARRLVRRRRPAG
jgi:selenocysteine-specific elongation factor